MKRKPYFCQTDLGTIDDARKWLSENGGGTIKKRGAGIINDPFIGEIKVWGIVDNVSS